MILLVEEKLQLKIIMKIVQNKYIYIYTIYILCYLKNIDNVNMNINVVVILNVLFNFNVFSR